MNWPGDEGPLREFIRKGLLTILEQLEVIIMMIETQNDLEARIAKLEEHKNTVSWLLRLSAAMSAGALLAYLIGLLR